MLTQTEIGSHLDLDQSTVSRLCESLRLDWRNSTIDQVRIAYIHHLREMAAGRATDGMIDLPTERALLARAQREGQEIKNEVARGSYAPIEALTDVLANASQAVVDHLDQIPVGINRVCPDLPQAVRNLLMTEIARARNEMVRKTVSLMADALEAGDVQEEEPAVLPDGDEVAA
jgi:phage terminase Nu1 subunit (DNA packaging protein)